MGERNQALGVSCVHPALLYVPSYVHQSLIYLARPLHISCISLLYNSHYIPVKGDFSDLDETVRYVVDPKNSDQIQQIIKNGQQFCRTKLTMEQYTVDMLWTLLSYAELLAESPDFYDTWRRNKSAYEMPALQMKPWKPRVAPNAAATRVQ